MSYNAMCARCGYWVTVVNSDGVCPRCLNLFEMDQDKLMARYWEYEMVGLDKHNPMAYAGWEECARIENELRRRGLLLTNETA